MKNVSIKLFLAILIVLNLFLILQLKEKNKKINNLDAEYSNSQKNIKQIFDYIENLYSLKNKSIKIQNDQLHKIISENNEVSQFIVVKQNVCQVCSDNLIVEIENLRNDFQN